MNTIELLRFQLKSAHDAQEGTVGNVTADSAHFTDTNKALPAGAAYAHSVLSEDMLLTSMVTHTPSLASTAETGLSELMPGFDKWSEHEAWAHRVKIDLPKFKSFAAKVYAATDAYIATLTDADLEKEIDLGAWGKKTLADLLTNFFILHAAHLTGEISAAQGFQGLKGYPW